MCACTIRSYKGQEVPSADGVPIKISLVYGYSVEDPNLAVNTLGEYSFAVTGNLQVALRNVVSRKYR